MMKRIFTRIGRFFRADIPCFFKITIPMFLDECSIGTKILLAIIGGVIGFGILLFLYLGAVMLIGSKTYPLELLHDQDQITQVEILHVGDDIHYGTEFTNVTVCAVLTKDQWTNLLCDLNDIPCYSTGHDSSPHIYGPAIRISYQNGDYEILSGHGFFQSSGDQYPWVNRLFPSEELVELLTSYGYQDP